MKKFLVGLLLTGLMVFAGTSVDARLIKSAEHPEIFEVNAQGEKSWLQDWDTFVYVADQKGLTWNELLARVGDNVEVDEAADPFAGIVDVPTNDGWDT